MVDYQIKPIGKVCAGTGQPLAPGSVCHSILIERNGELVRLDYSEAAWKGPPPEAVGVWKTRIDSFVAEKPMQFDLTAIYRQFEELTEETNPLQIKIRYIMALLLLQKRRLQLDGTRKDADLDLLLLSGTRGEGHYEVVDLKLPADEIKLLQKELLAAQQSEASLEE
jgi:hypothetical protein